jgi:hypothetical protein
VGLPAEVSQPVEFVMVDTAEGEGTLLEAHVVDPSPGLRVVQTGLVESGEVANGEPYPPTDLPTEIPADYQGPTPVAIAVAADRPGAYDGHGVVLVWMSGGERFVEYRAIGFRLCVGASRCNSHPVTEEILTIDVDDALEPYR